MIKEQNARQSTMNVFYFYADIYSLYGLAYACPYLDWKGDCPLKAIERIPFKQNVIWINRKCAVKGLFMSRFDKSFAFKLFNNKMNINQEIPVPGGFSWEDTAKGLVPVYGLPKLK